MPNKTIYVREEDLEIWDAAQKQLGLGISKLFAQFLREEAKKIMKPVDTIVNVAQFAPGVGSGSTCFAVTAAPVGPNSSGGAVKLRQVGTEKELRALLTGVRLSREDIGEVLSELRKQGWASIRADLPWESLREW